MIPDLGVRERLWFGEEHLFAMENLAKIGKGENGGGELDDGEESDDLDSRSGPLSFLQGCRW